MTLGTGVFLAAIVMSLTALFIATKDRWNWKKIVLWPLGLLILGACIIGGMLAYENWRSNSKVVWDKPTVHDELWGIALGTKPEDVLFKKGKPTTKGEDQWLFAPEFSDDWYQLIFENGAVAVIAFYGKNFSAEKLDGIGRWDSTEEVTKLYGEPTRVATREDGAHRVYCYDAYHVFFSLKENKVVAYGIYQPGTEQLSCARPPKDVLQGEPKKGTWRDAVKKGEPAISPAP